MNKAETISPNVEDARATEEARPILVLGEEERERLGVMMEKIESSKRQRDQRRVEFDNLTYEQDYVANKNAANAYLFPKSNDDEVRIVTGTTEKKIEVLNNEVMAMNLQAEVIAYDNEDNMLEDLGQDMADIVKRTNQMEKDEDFDQAVLRELLTQRALFVMDEDEYVTFNNRGWHKNSATEPDGAKTSYVSGVHHRVRKRLISGLRVFLGDISVPARDFQTDQPYVVLYTRMQYGKAKAKYRNWERFQYVSRNAGGASGVVAGVGDYKMFELAENEVEELIVLDAENNEYYILLNGVPMLQKSTCLPYPVYPWRRYNIAMVVMKEMDTDFAYGKPPVASAKTLQALNDETLRNLVRKFRQALEPAMGSTGNTVYSRDIWEPGSVTMNIDKDEFFLLNPSNAGVTQSEFNLYDLIEKKTEEFIGAGALQQGIAESGEQTATEIQALQRNAIKNLGHIVAAFMRYKRDTTYLRIYTIIENFTEPAKKVYNQETKTIQDFFHRFTVDKAVFSDGTKGKKIIQFMNEDPNDKIIESAYEYEVEQEKAGKPTRVRYINVARLKDIMLFWYVTVSQQQREGSALSKAMFADAIRQASEIAQLSGTQLNPDTLQEEFEDRWQFKRMFVKNTNRGIMQGEGEVPVDEQADIQKRLQMQDRTATEQGMREGVVGGTQRPSLSEIMKE